MTKAAEDVLVSRLRRYIQGQCGPDSEVAGLAPMTDGHAGLTYGFEVCGNCAGRYVLKMAPAGVRRRGNTDVYRQAPLLRALRQVGVPVPEVPWASPRDAELGTPFIIMQRLPGRSFIVWEPHSSFGRDREPIRTLWLEAAKLLAQVHRVDWRTTLAGWEAPRALTDELARWASVLGHAQKPSWLEAGRALEQRLRETLPETTVIGLVHGDFQPGNVLYENGRPTGLIDWELAFIGAQGLDLGWLAMMSDPAGWDPGWAPLAPVSRADLVEAYRGAGGVADAAVDWFHALANYRMGAIACLNVKLHRTGKRPDELWERFAPSIDHLFSRGIQLLGGETPGEHNHIEIQESGP